MSAALARREIRARPGRFGWLIVAVTVAVGFTVGAFGFSSQLTRLLDPATTAPALNTLPAGSVVLTAETDAVTSATALDERLLAKVRAVDGVALAEGSYDQPIAFRLPAGSQPERPTILRGVVLSSTWQPSKWEIEAGRPPVGPDELVVDVAGLAVGQTSSGAEVTMDLPTGKRRMRIVGIARPAGSASIVPADSPNDAAALALASAHAIFDAELAPALLDAVGRVDRITVLPSAGLEPEVLEQRLRAAMPPGVRVTASLNRMAITQHTVERIDEGVRAAVGGFAGLTVLISSLVVANTLSVLVAQRTREFGLLRLVGASRRQVLAMVMGESLGIGMIGSATGLGLGVVLASVAARVVRDSTVPVGFALTWSMVVVAGLVGVVVTFLGGVLPALRAGRIAPIAALSDTRGGSDRVPHWSVPTASFVFGVGLMAGAVVSGDGLDGPAGVVAVLGVIVGFVGIVGLSRWIVRPLLSAMGVLLDRVAGPSGRIGLENARRQPSRTAGAASTLMVGLALVATVGTVGASIRSTVRSQFDTASRADVYLERRGVVRVSTAGLENELFRRLQFRSRGRVDYAALTSVDGVLVGPTGATAQAEASNLASLDNLVDLGVTSGSVETAETAGDLGEFRTHVILSDSAADSLGVRTGDGVTLRTISGTEIPLRVAATYTNTAIAGSAVVDMVPSVQQSALGTFELGLARFAGPGDHRVEQVIADVARDFPKVRVHTPDQFGELNASVADTVLGIIGVVLVGMIGIGYLGLVATLGLSTLERRKELVMLRAVGAARSQVRTMVIVEASLIAVIAAAVGLTLGVAGGWLAAVAAPSDLVTRVVIPWSGLAAVGVGSLVTATVVSLGVARRASFVPPAEAGR